ncbi:MAG: EamA family transporter [Burkholderiales bacterium]|nr:EamA family transporter [Burkholderiales bacterium]
MSPTPNIPLTSPRLPVVYLKLVLTAACWGGVFHAGRYAVHLMSPLAAGAWRFTLAALIFMPLVAWREGWALAAIKRNALVLGIMSAVGVFGFNIGMFFGLKSTSAVNGALIVAVTPALTAVLAALLNRRAPSVMQVIGLALGMAGVAMVVSHGSLDVLLSLQLSQGDAWVLLAAFCWAIYSVLPQRFIKGLSSLQVAGSTIIGGAVLMIGFGAKAAPDLLQVPPMGAMLGIVFMAVFGSVLAYMWWNDGIQVIGPAQAAIFMNFVPLFAALIGVLLGEHLAASQLLGAALVIGGVLSSTVLNKARPASQQVEKGQGAEGVPKAA